MDASHFAYENFIDSDDFNKLFTESERLDELRVALHIKKTRAFMRSNSTVAGAIIDRERNSAFVFSELLSRGLKVLINVGNYDMKDGVRSTLEWIKQIDFPGR
jgi:Icc-related predicted phosphoesterase